MDTAINASCASSGRQSAQMSKITNDGLTRSGTGCFIAVPIWQQWAGRQKVKFWYIVIKSEESLTRV